MVEIDTLFQTKKAKKTFWRGAYLYRLYKGLKRGEKRVADYEFRLRKRD